MQLKEIKAGDMSHQQEETNELSKREKLEQAASDMGFKIAFKDKMEFHSKYIRILWSDGSYTSIMVEIKPVLIQDDSTLKLDYKLISTNHRIL